jgi:hypothetical protein
MTPPSPAAIPLTKRPFGVIVAESYFITYIALISFRLIVSLDIYSLLVVKLNLHFFHFMTPLSRAPELIFGVLSVLAVIGIQQMRAWGRLLAIVLAGVKAASVIWYYAVVLIWRLWTLVPHGLWPHVESTVKLGCGIYVVWYLLQPEVRRAFQPSANREIGVPGYSR